MKFAHFFIDRPILRPPLISIILGLGGVASRTAMRSFRHPRRPQISRGLERHLSGGERGRGVGERGCAQSSSRVNGADRIDCT